MEKTTIIAKGERISKFPSNIKVVLSIFNFNVLVNFSFSIMSNDHIVFRPQTMETRPVQTGPINIFQDSDHKVAYFRAAGPSWEMMVDFTHQISHKLV